MRISCVLLVALLCPVVLLGQNRVDVEEIKTSVVKITSKAPEGQTQTGTGFIVRVDGELIYIATASHVVEGDQKPLVTFYHDKRRPVVAQIEGLEGGDPKGLGYLIVRDRAIAKQVKALPWSAEILRGGEDVVVIGFGEGEWGVIKRNVVTVAGSDIRIDGRIEGGYSGGPIVMNGSVAGMVVSTQGFGVGKPGIIVQTTLRGWGVEISASPRKYASLVGNWLGAPSCTLVFRVDNGKNVEGSCNTAAVRHEFAGVYQTDDRVRITITRIDPNQCKTTVAGYVTIENDDTIEVSQDGWDGCQVKTGPDRSRLQRSAKP